MMSDKQMRLRHSYPSLPEVMEVLSYDPASGYFFWLPRPQDAFADGAVSAAHTFARWNRQHANKRAGSVDVRGYRKISFGRPKRVYYEHRLAFIYMTGSCPDFVDHINGSRDDNRWSNLRAATMSQNMGNVRSYGTLLKGVAWDKGRIRNPYRAHVYKNGKNHYLGRFPTQEEAHAAYVAAAKELHGEFFCSGAR